MHNTKTNRRISGDPIQAQNQRIVDLQTNSRIKHRRRHISIKGQNNISLMKNDHSQLNLAGMMSNNRREAHTPPLEDTLLKFTSLSPNKMQIGLKL